MRAMTVEDKKYQAQDDLRTLQRAHEIKSNAKRHVAAKQEGRKQQSALTKVIGTKRGK